MELKHHFTVPTPLEETWHSFNQLEEIATCFPGATLTSVDGDTFTGTVKIKLGPIAMMYTGTGEFVSRDEAAHTVVIQASGKDKRGNGTAGATVTAVLIADGDNTTVDVSTDMNVTGKPAQFGRGVIQDVSDKLLEQFVQCVIGKAGADPVSEPVQTPISQTPVSEPVQTPVSADPARPAPSQPVVELDLGSAVVPVLIRRFAPAILGALAAITIVAWLVRRCQCRRK
ncbi:SRPBCC family protein [Arthrobacter alpinus]|uniref:SRPBCC family protein n=1 Tax=Arthrobacter alpinus TaxID=656366 RepID=UPI0016454D77|nr:SRPBCC family protein [Arthrobacter alpinus]